MFRGMTAQPNFEIRGIRRSIGILLVCSYLPLSQQRNEENVLFDVIETNTSISAISKKTDFLKDNSVKELVKTSIILR